MKKAGFTILACLLTACSHPETPAVAVATDGPSLSKVYDNAVGSVEKEVVSLVEAMPADKINFAPTGGKLTGVRTFALQAKHIASVNYMLAAAILNEKTPIDLGKGENGPDSVASAADVTKFLKDSFTYAHKAAQSITPANQ